VIDSSTGVRTRIHWGESGDIPVPESYGSCNFTTLPAVYTPTTGTLTVKGYQQFTIGGEVDIIPVPIPGSMGAGIAATFSVFLPWQDSDPDGDFIVIPANGCLN
jgi:hypothetical protein